VKRLDSASKSNGSAQYTLDINDPGTLTALIARSPRFGGTVRRVRCGGGTGGSGRGRCQAGAERRCGLCKGLLAGEDRARPAQDYLERQQGDRVAAATAQTPDRVSGAVAVAGQDPSSRKAMSTRRSPRAAASSRRSMCFPYLAHGPGWSRLKRMS